MSQLNKDIIKLQNIHIEFDDETIIEDLNLSIKDKEFVTLLGPSGCGKTTTLRTIAGFVTPDRGDIIFDGVKINNLPPHKRQVNTVFQKYALFTHLNVYDNIAFGLRINKTPKDEIDRKIHEILEIVNLKGYHKRSIDSLSGGQQQRVAIARALVNSPRVLLLDEPLGALDLKLRKDMQIELKRIQKQTGITFVYVTHDQEEALTMSDTVVVMKDGFIQQIGKPKDIYDEPANAFVADFIGESNILNGIMIRDFLVHFDDAEFVCVDKGFGENVPVDVVVRPEDIAVCDPGKGTVKAIVKIVTFKGVHYEMIAQSKNYSWKIHSTECRAEGSEIGLNIAPDLIHIMKKEAGTAN
jgi:spermidine/putrescine transport system ATP-binding protein